MPTDRYGLALDAVLLLGVPALLVAVHVSFPTPIKALLESRYADPDPLTAVTAAYLHHTDAHLYGNLLGYAVGGGVTYALCRSTGQRRWFRFTFLSLLTPSLA